MEDKLGKHARRKEGEDKSAFQIGDQRGEGGQQDIQDELGDHDELKEEFVGMAQTGEQTVKDEEGSGRH
jgi:hypothetical protein